ncbi:MAG: TetR/AcrR family transcriptional regulator [Dehalococcoidia bacterium]|nr:TetR/AcrR family transcriptional regulator [Dehalococcoidia bacterium]
MTKVRDLDQVLDVAARLFGERGYEATRLDDIARELGVLKGSLYYYTSSKADLLRHINGRRLSELIDNVSTILESHASARERLERILREHLRFIDLYHPESSQWFEPMTTTTRRTPRTRGEPPPDAERLNHRYAALVTRAVEDGQRSGEFRHELDPKVAALGLLGASNWLTRWYEKGGRLGVEEISDTLVTMLLHGLTTDVEDAGLGDARPDLGYGGNTTGPSSAS